MFRPSTSQEVALISRYLTQIPVPPASGGKRSLENSSLFAVSGEAEISDIELSALLVDRAFAGSRENGQYSLGFGSPGEWRFTLEETKHAQHSAWPCSHLLGHSYFRPAGSRP